MNTATIHFILEHSGYPLFFYAVTHHSDGDVTMREVYYADVVWC